VREITAGPQRKSGKADGMEAQFAVRKLELHGGRTRNNTDAFSNRWCSSMCPPNPTQNERADTTKSDIHGAETGMDKIIADDVLEELRLIVRMGRLKCTQKQREEINELARKIAQMYDMPPDPDRPDPDPRNAV
jgi:hypothetical protein